MTYPYQFGKVAISVLFLAMCCLGAFAAEKQEADWMLAKDQQGVKIYTRQVQGIDFKAFKGVTTIKTSLSSLVALVMDAQASPDWMKNCSQSKLLKQVNAKECFTYSLSKAPWPVKDRDSIIHHVISQAKGTRAVTIKQVGKPDYIKENKDILRVKRIEGFWRFTPRKDGHVDVVYQALSDPGGAIPVWLVNSMLVAQPYETLLKMQKVVQREKYQKAKLAFIVE